MAYRTNEERETIILMNAARNTVEVYTADPVYIRKCDKLVAADPENWKLVKETEDSKTYETTKPYIKLRQKRAASGRPFKPTETA